MEVGCLQTVQRVSFTIYSAWGRWSMRFGGKQPFEGLAASDAAKEYQEGTYPSLDGIDSQYARVLCSVILSAPAILNEVGNDLPIPTSHLE